MNIKKRQINKEVYQDALEHDFPEVIAHILAGRLDQFDENFIDAPPSCVLPASSMTDCPKAAKRIAKAITEGQKILIFTDYDVDGCTSMAILYRAMRDVFSVPENLLVQLTGHRTKDGYGLTENVAQQIIDVSPALVITADAGSSDHDRLTQLSRTNIDVIVTDHHLLPVEGVPDGAYAVVNPQREDCPYDSEIAGCGVAWLLMTAVSQELVCDKEARIKLLKLLDFVALGTVADMVKLNSPINRYFVKKGLEFMNQLDRECWRLAFCGKPAKVGILGFQVGPRINATPRMTGKIDTAIKFLVSEDPDEIRQSYDAMDFYNDQRKDIEKDMLDLARQQYVEGVPHVIAHHESFDPGVQGIVASKLVDEFGVPAIMLSNLNDSDYIVGSGRAGQFLHLRDALQFIDDHCPGLLKSFGGHKAAAGLKFHKDNLLLFKEVFMEAVEQQFKDQDITPFIRTDGALNSNLCLETHYNISRLSPFGMGFSTPIFSDTMKVTEARMVGGNPVHLSMRLDGIKAIQFYAIDNPEDPMPVKVGDTVDVVYNTDVNEFRGNVELQLMVKRIEVNKSILLRCPDQSLI